MNKKKIISLVILVLWIGFIYGNSLLTGAESGKLSGGITEMISNILSRIGINITIENLHLIIRKGAHFSEYFILGIIVLLNYIQYMKELRYFMPFSFISCLLISIIDETIQTFIDGRAGSIVDVCIDTAGFTLSIIIVTIIILNHKKKKEQEA